MNLLYVAHLKKYFTELYVILFMEEHRFLNAGLIMLSAKAAATDVSSQVMPSFSIVIILFAKSI